MSQNSLLIKTLIVIVVTGLLLLPDHAVVGQEPDSQQPENLDRVELRQGITNSTKIGVWNPLQVITLEGQIQSFDAKSLVLIVKAADGKVDSKTISSNQVQRVFPVWRGTGTQAAVKLFEQHKYHEFGQALRGLKFAEIPNWQNVLITGMLIQAFEAHNQLSKAGDTFIELAKSPIPELIYADMSLSWTVSSIDVSVSAKSWIEQDSEAAKLLGASWLLLGEDSQKAKSVLSELQKSKSPPIAQLAKAQAWRLVPVPQTMEQLTSWMAERDRMLRPLALGPTEFISDRLMRIGQHDLAIGLACQIATSYSDRFPRARRALVSAVEMLKKQGRKADEEKMSAWIKQLDGAN
jgi:hypothetical protein